MNENTQQKYLTHLRTSSSLHSLSISFPTFIYLILLPIIKLLTASNILKLCTVDFEFLAVITFFFNVIIVRMVEDVFCDFFFKVVKYVNWEWRFERFSVSVWIVLEIVVTSEWTSSTELFREETREQERR